MPTVTGDERYVNDYHEGLLKKCTFEIGLVTGCGSQSRTTILRLMRTPDPDGAGPPKAVSALDVEWVAEHARQVSYALPGGVSVLGFYVFCKGADAAAAEAALGAQLSTMAGKLGGSPAVLLLLPTDSRRATCRSTSAGAQKLTVAELKLGRGAPAMHAFEGTWAVDVRAEVCYPPDAPSEERARLIVEVVRAACRPALERLKHARASVDGELTTADASEQPVSKLPAAGAAPKGAAAPEQAPCSAVRFFSSAPALGAPPQAPAGAGSSAGSGEAAPVRFRLQLSGAVHGRAYAAPKDSIAHAVGLLKLDLESTLQRRLGLLRDDLTDVLGDAEEGEEEGGSDEEGDGDGPPKARRGALTGRTGPDVQPLARRVFAEGALTAGVPLCDYLGPTDDADDLGESFELMLATTLAPADAARVVESAREVFEPAADVLQRVTAAAAKPQTGRTGPGSAKASAAAAGSGARADGGQGKTNMLAVAFAVLVAVLAVAATALGMTASTATPPPAPATASITEQPPHADSDQPVGALKAEKVINYPGTVGDDGAAAPGEQ